jgi:hypothetical protein
LLAVLLAPFIYLGNFLLRRRLAHRKPDVTRENAAILDDLWSFGMMTSRSIVVIATKGTNAA